MLSTNLSRGVSANTASSRSRTQLQIVCLAPETRKIKGLKYDGSNLRWVRDERYGSMNSYTVQPKTGIAYTVWPVVHTVLTEKKLKRVTVEEASAMSAKGWTLVDVRAARDYEMEHAEGAVNVPLYRPVAGNEFWDVLKRVAMAGFAMQATERNPDFVEVALENLKKNEKIIIMCNIGGTLETLFKPSSHKKGINDPDRAFGRESRSLKAAYEIIEAGGWNANNVVFVEGGVQMWRHRGFPVV